MRCAAATSACFSSTEKSSPARASSISRLWSAESSTLPVTLAVAASVSSATSARIWPSAFCVSASICLRVSSSRRWRSASVSSLARAPVRVGDLARLGEDLLGVVPGLGDQGAVLLDQLVRLGAGVVRLVEGGADLLAPLVDRGLDPAERELLQREEDDAEADDRPDHEPRDDLDQR